MATNIRRSTPPVVKKIVAHPQRFNYYQLLYYLEAYPEIDFYVRPAVSSAFPRTDIASAHFDEKAECLTLQVNFMGLYGVDSPLPSYLINLAHHTDEAGACLRDFLDVLHQRCYHLLYDSWCRYHFGYQPLAMPFHDALQGGRVVTLNHLTQTIMRHLGDLPFSVSQFIPCWSYVAETSLLGQGSHLGSLLLGERCLEQQTHLQLHLGQSDFRQLRPWLPTEKRLSTLYHDLLELLGTTRHIDLIYHFHLDKQGDNLGWNTCLTQANASSYELQYPQSLLTRCHHATRCN